MQYFFIFPCSLNIKLSKNTSRILKTDSESNMLLFCWYACSYHCNYSNNASTASSQWGVTRRSFIRLSLHGFFFITPVLKLFLATFFKPGSWRHSTATWSSRIMWLNLDNKVAAALLKFRADSAPRYWKGFKMQGNFLSTQRARFPVYSVKHSGDLVFLSVLKEHSWMYNILHLSVCRRRDFAWRVRINSFCPMHSRNIFFTPRMVDDGDHHQLSLLDDITSRLCPWLS